jgi:hypothetical protein
MPTRPLRAPDPGRYSAFVDHFFGYLPSEEAKADWERDIYQRSFAVENAEVAPLFVHLMHNSGADLASFDDRAVSVGLEALFFTTECDFASRLANLPGSAGVPRRVGLEHQCAAIASIGSLYSDCLAPRLDPDRAGARKGTGRLGQYFTYMLWDASPLGYWHGNGPNDPRVAALLQMLGKALEIPNAAIIRGVLHGLGHLGGGAASARERIVRRFLARHGEQLPKSLAEYARAAAEGRV